MSDAAVGRSKRARTASATEASHSLEAFWLQDKATAKAPKSDIPHAMFHAAPHATSGQCLALARNKRSKRSIVVAYPSEDDKRPIAITQTDLEDLSGGLELSDSLVNVCLRQFRQKMRAKERVDLTQSTDDPIGREKGTKALAKRKR